MGNSLGTAKNAQTTLVIISPHRIQDDRPEVASKSRIVTAACTTIERIANKTMPIYSFTDKSHEWYEEYCSSKAYRGRMTVRAQSRARMMHLQNKPTWILDINTNTSKTYDCIIYFPPNDSSAVLAEDLSKYLFKRSICVSTNLCYVQHDVIIEASELGFVQVLRIEIGEYMAKDRAALIAQYISEWLK